MSSVGITYPIHKKDPFQQGTKLVIYVFSTLCFGSADRSSTSLVQFLASSAPTPFLNNLIPLFRQWPSQGLLWKSSRIGTDRVLHTAQLVRGHNLMPACERVYTTAEGNACIAV